MKQGGVSTRQNLPRFLSPEFSSNVFRKLCTDQLVIYSDFRIDLTYNIKDLVLCYFIEMSENTSKDRPERFHITNMCLYMSLNKTF
jgi:hypothetical protein